MVKGALAPGRIGLQKWLLAALDPDHRLIARAASIEP